MRVIFLAIIALLLCAVSAQAASLIGTACPTVGQTKMDNDNVNLVACLRTSTSDSALIWKSMTTNTVSCSSGMAVTSISNGIPACSAVTSSSSIKAYACPTIGAGGSYNEPLSGSDPYGYGGTSIPCRRSTIQSSTCNGQISTVPTCSLSIACSSPSFTYGTVGVGVSISCSQL